MKKRIFAFLFAAVLAPLFAMHAQAQVAVIVNPGVKAAEVSKGDLKDVFTGASTSLKGGGRVTPVLQKGGSAHDVFLSTFVGKNDTAFRADWRSLVFSGQATMPKSMDSDAAVVEYVAHTPGAIGYISKFAAHDGVKVLTVE
jgi:ABC-type phosphate transport system substrate-binding protein